MEEILETRKDEVMALVHGDLERIANHNQFNSLEKVKGHFRLVSTDFEIMGILTPTMKLKRHAAKDAFANHISDIYENSEDNKQIV